MSVEKHLNKFAKSVVAKSKSNLKKKDKLASKKLHDSIGYKLTVNKNSFSLSFVMEDYGKFVDKGVKGKGGKKKDGTRWKLKRTFGTKYKYKDKMPPPRVFSKWTIKKGIAPRGSKGRFAKRKSLQFAIAKSVFHTGLETTHFFTKPFEDEFKKLPDQLVEAYGLEIDNFFEFATK